MRNFPKREELSLSTVHAFPKASRIGEEGAGPTTRRRGEGRGRSQRSGAQETSWTHHLGSAIQRQPVTASPPPGVRGRPAATLALHPVASPFRRPLTLSASLPRLGIKYIMRGWESGPGGLDAVSDGLDALAEGHGGLGRGQECL